jgi:hypothetical protein
MELRHFNANADLMNSSYFGAKVIAAVKFTADPAE